VIWEIRWSILVCGIPGRNPHTLLSQLEHQRERLPEPEAVEVLYLYDTRHRSTGMKRNALLELSQGFFISFVDDDDRIAPNYVGDIYQAIVTHPDVDLVTFLIAMQYYDTVGQLFEFPARLDYRLRGGLNPIHTAVWRRSLAVQATFPDTSRLEDEAWASAVRPLARTTHHIDRELYFYDWREGVSTTWTPPDSVLLEGRKVWAARCGVKL